jgi:hypothetical protein
MLTKPRSAQDSSWAEVLKFESVVLPIAGGGAAAALGGGWRRAARWC